MMVGWFRLGIGFTGESLYSCSLLCFGCAPCLQVFCSRQEHGVGQGSLALLAGDAPGIPPGWTDGYKLVLVAPIADDLDQLVFLAFGALRPDENRTVGVKLRATFQAKITIRIGITRVAGDIFLAP